MTLETVVYPQFAMAQGCASPENGQSFNEHRLLGNILTIIRLMGQRDLCDLFIMYPVLGSPWSLLMAVMVVGFSGKVGWSS